MILVGRWCSQDASQTLGPRAYRNRLPGQPGGPRPSVHSVTGDIHPSHFSFLICKVD